MPISDTIGSEIVQPFPVTGVVQSDGNGWIAPAGIEDLNDVPVLSPIAPETFRWNGAAWNAQNIVDPMPLQTGNSGLHLSTNGSAVAWTDARNGVTVTTDLNIPSVGISTAFTNLGTTANTSVNLNLNSANTLITTLSAASPVTITFDVSGLSTTSSVKKTVIITNNNGVAVNWPGTILWEFGRPPENMTAGTTAIYSFNIVQRNTIYGYISGEEFS